MIKSITLKNWKSFGEATLYVDPLTVLIGTNASGKSNFLDAIDFLAALINGRDVESLFEENDLSKRIIRGSRKSQFGDSSSKLVFEVVVPMLNSNSGDYIYSVALAYVEQTDKIFISSETVHEKRADETIEVLRSKNTSRSVFGLNLSDYTNRHPNLPGTSGIMQAAFDIYQALKVVFIDPIPQNMRDYTTTSLHLLSDCSNIAGYLAKHPQKNIVEEQISEALRNLPENEVGRIWAEKVGLLGSDAMLYCEEKWPGKNEPMLVDARGLSDGTLRLIAILTALLTAEEGSTLVIEEIDNGIHPSRAELLVKLLHKIGTERRVDIICTTHNPALLDAFGLSMLPFIALVYRDPENGTSQIKNLDEIKNYERIITKGSLGDLITKGRFEGALKAH